MNEDTIHLLKEVDSGCLMAMDSLRQMKDYEMDTKEREMIKNYIEKHDEIQKEASALLHENHEPDKTPGVMASTMSWLTTEIKMMMHNEGSQIAKIIMNGCNMGIQSIGENLTKSKTASEEAGKLARKLINVEEGLFSDAIAFL